MGSDREKKAVVGAAFAETLQHLEDLDVAEAVAAQLARDGHGEEPVVGASLPCIAENPLLLRGVSGRRGSRRKFPGKLEGRFLKWRHWRPRRIQTASTRSF